MTPHEFLNAIFPADLREPDESVLVSWPDSFTDRDTGQIVNYYRQRAWHPRAAGLFPEGAGWLYCVSTVVTAAKLRRRLTDVRAAFVLPCDDVGSKCDVPPVAPSYVLETSPGNYQYGYLLEPYDVSTGEGAAYYDACLLGLAQAGFNDFGCRSASRVVKLPGATHKTGFISRLVEWHPNRHWDLDILMAEMGVKPCRAAMRNTYRRGRGSRVVLEDVDDPIYDWLVKAGLTGASSDEWVEIDCPWAHLHSEGGSLTAGYSPLDYGLAGRGFKCFHSHGEQHGLQQFLAWVESQDGPSTDPSYQRLRAILRNNKNV